jgi:hypothetical protein
MASLQIDEFYHDASRILVSLFEVFPRPVTVFAEDISGPDDPDEFGLHSKRYQACFATMLWLAEEGYIRYDDVIRQDAIEQAVLTGRCFSALLKPQDVSVDNALPESVQLEQKTTVYRLRQALQSHNSSQLQAAFLPLLDTLSQ